MRRDTDRLPSHITAFACTFPDFKIFSVTLAHDPRKNGIDIPQLLDDKHDERKIDIDIPREPRHKVGPTSMRKDPLQSGS